MTPRTNAVKASDASPHDLLSGSVGQWHQAATCLAALTVTRETGLATRDDGLLASAVRLLEDHGLTSVRTLATPPGTPRITVGTR